MYRIALACEGVPEKAGAQAALDIAAEFKDHRSWHTNVQCAWDGTRLLLTGENDYDVDGEALADEFSDAVAACVPGVFGYRVTVVSVGEVLL